MVVNRKVQPTRLTKWSSPANLGLCQIPTASDVAQNPQSHGCPGSGLGNGRWFLSVWHCLLGWLGDWFGLMKPWMTEDLARLRLLALMAMLTYFACWEKTHHCGACLNIFIAQLEVGVGGPTHGYAIGRSDQESQQVDTDR